jgi:hypothetical protein
VQNNDQLIVGHCRFCIREFAIAHAAWKKTGTPGPIRTSSFLLASKTWHVNIDNSCKNTKRLRNALILGQEAGSNKQTNGPGSAQAPLP